MHLLFVNRHSLQGVVSLLISLDCYFDLFVKFLIENAWNFGIKEVGLADDAGPALNQLLLQKVGVFTDFEVLREELALHQSQS